MKVYVCMTDKTIGDSVDKIFIYKKDAEEYTACCDYMWIEEHEVIE